MNSNGFSYYVDSALIRVNQNSYMFSNVDGHFLTSCREPCTLTMFQYPLLHQEACSIQRRYLTARTLPRPKETTAEHNSATNACSYQSTRTAIRIFLITNLTYQVTFTDSAPQLAGVLNNGAWSPLSWDMVPNAPTLETNINQIIQNGFNEWSNAFAAYGSPSLFTFRQVNALPADIHFYVVRIQETSTGRIVHEAGYYEFMESQTPYVAGIVLTVLPQPNALNAHVVHEVSHAFGLGHFCSVNPWNNPAPVATFRMVRTI